MLYYAKLDKKPINYVCVKVKRENLKEANEMDKQIKTLLGICDVEFKEIVADVNAPTIISDMILKLKEKK